MEAQGEIELYSNTEDLSVTLNSVNLKEHEISTKNSDFTAVTKKAVYQYNH